MKKPLYFRNNRYGSTESAQRDKIVYEVKYSMWYEGKSTGTAAGELPAYHVTRWDAESKDYISTEKVKRFNTVEEAKAYCQDMYEGKIDLDALRAEIQADIAERERLKNEVERRDADKFKDILHDKQIALPVFLEIVKAWHETPDASRSLLYREVDER